MKKPEKKISPPFDLQERVLLEFLSKHPRITLRQYMKLVNISQSSAYRILVKLVLLGAIRLHEKEKESYYTIC